MIRTLFVRSATLRRTRTSTTLFPRFRRLSAPKCSPKVNHRHAGCVDSGLTFRASSFDISGELQSICNVWGIYYVLPWCHWVIPGTGTTGNVVTLSCENYWARIRRGLVGRREEFPDNNIKIKSTSKILKQLKGSQADKIMHFYSVFFHTFLFDYSSKPAAGWQPKSYFNLPSAAKERYNFF